MHKYTPPTPLRQAANSLSHGDPRSQIPLHERGRRLSDVDYLAEIERIKRDHAERAQGLSSLHISPDQREMATALVALGARMLQLHRTRPPLGPDDERPGGPRGKVNRFSAGSRRRLMIKLNSLNRTKPLRATLITLTYPGEFSRDARQWKRDLDTLNKRLTRKWGGFPIFWKLEFQKRGAPDIHLLAYDPQMRLTSYLFREWLSHAWYRVVGSGDERHLRAGTRTELPRHARALESYCTKYVGKPVEGTGHVGRYWGVWHGSLLPVQLGIVSLSLLEHLRAARTLRRLLHHRGHKRTARHAFMPQCEALRLLLWAISPP